MPGPMNAMCGGMNFALPDVCNTPMPPVGEPTPIPYPNMGDIMMTMPPTAAMTVLCMNMPSCNLNSEIMMTEGDEPGVEMGVASGMDMGEARYMLGSESVLVQNMPAVSMGDMTGHNGMSPNAVGATIAPGQTSVMVMS